MTRYFSHGFSTLLHCQFYVNAKISNNCIIVNVHTTGDCLLQLAYNHVVHCLKIVLAWCFVIGLGTCCSRVAIVFMYPVCAIDC